jgi:ribosomal protein L33
MAKVKKESSFLFSSAGTGFFYTVRRNRKKVKGETKLKKKKYDPIARAYVLFEEKKSSRLKRKFSLEKFKASAPVAEPAETKAADAPSPAEKKANKAKAKEAKA